MKIDPTGTTEWWELLLGIAIIVAAVGLTFITGGIGSAIAGAVGHGIWGAIVGGAVVGAINGAITGFGISVGIQGISNGFGNINWGQVGIDTVIGAVSGGIAGGVFGGIKYLYSVEKLANSVSGLKTAQENYAKAAEALKNTPMLFKGGVMSTERIAAQLAYDVASANWGYAQSISNIANLIINGIYWIAENGLSYVIGLIPNAFVGG